MAVALFSVASTSALVLALEFGQLFIRGRSPGLRDALVSVTCVVFASGLAAWWPRGGVRGARSLGELTRSTPWFVLAFAVLAPTLRALQPFELGDVHAELEALTIWRFVPFATLFKNLNPWTFWNVFEASVVYLPLGYALFASGRSPGFGFMVCAGLAVLLEVLQIPIVGRTFDITEGIYAGLMALAGVWLFTSLRELSASEQGENRGAPTIDLPDVGRRARNVRVPPPEAATVPLQVPPRRKG